MTRRDDELTLRQMRQHAMEAIDLLQGRTEHALETDRILGLAIVRLLEIVGEAAARVSADTRQRNPGIPWAEIVGLRNRLIHGYDAVDMAIVWEVATKDLPDLISELEKALEVDPDT